MWWDELCVSGPKYGYYPKPSKTVLIVKQEHEAYANQIFNGTGIEITTSGQRHLGAVLGTTSYRDAYIKDKVEKWITDIEELAEIAVEEPQAALSAYTKAMCHRWTFIQRTVPNISDLFIPLETTIRDKFIPAIIGRQISDIEREMISLLVRFGGLGIANPVITADREYSASKEITSTLTELIKRQEHTLESYSIENVHKVTKKLAADKESELKQKQKDISNKLDKNTARALNLAQEKGAGAWLTALPLSSMGYTLNKEEFRDSIRLRYGWHIKNIPAYCVCDAKNNGDHALTCKRGGFSIYRHNKIRDVNAEFLKQVCHDVQLEPELIPIESEEFHVTGNNNDRARLDISARGLWGPFQRTLFDVRVFHPRAPIYKEKSITELYKIHEHSKIREYQHRVLQTEKASFTPLIYSTNGGMAPQSVIFHKRLALLIAEKRRERYGDVLSCLRTKISFAMLKSVLISIRGTRGRTMKNWVTPVSCVSFNLIPEAHSYESF